MGERKDTTCKKNLPQRKNIRLNDYDYSKEGMYFITICTKNRQCILLKDVGADASVCPEMALTKIGLIAKKEIEKTEELRGNIKINQYTIMPNHIHIIIENVGAHCMRPQKYANTIMGACNAPLQRHENGIDKIIRGLKGSITKQIGYGIWQRNYYEHVIRNEKEYYKIYEYIENNLINWDKDKYKN